MESAEHSPTNAAPQQQRPTTLARLVTVIATAQLVAAFFLPYVSVPPDDTYYRGEDAESHVLLEDIGMTRADMADLSLFEYVRVYTSEQGMEIMGGGFVSTFYIVTTVLPAALAVLALLFALGGRPVPVIVFSVLSAGASYLVQWDFVARRIVYEGVRSLGIACPWYYVAGALTVACAIWLLVIKRANKRSQRQVAAGR